MSNSAKVPQSIAPQAQAVHHEARNAANSAAFLIPTLRSLEASHPGAKLLDVGAGSGTITLNLAELIPSGEAIGIDVNSGILPRARANAEAKGVTNVSFQEGDIYKLPFDDESFDVTFCHMVITHLQDPKKAMKEMLRVTKRGGHVAIREGDYATEAVWPELKPLIAFHDLIGALMEKGGGSIKTGRQLLSWALEVGVSRANINVSYSTWSYNTAEDRRIWADGLMNILRGNGQYRETALKAGLATSDELEAMAETWDRWAGMDDATLVMTSGEIIIEKQ